jgi:hypothetical protein
MSWFYLVITLVAAFLLILSLTTLRLRLKYRRRGKDDQLALEFSFWYGIIFYKLEIPVVEMNGIKAKPAARPGNMPLRWLAPRPAFKIKTEIEGKEGQPIAEEKKKVPIPGPVRLIEIVFDTLYKIKKYMPVMIYLLRRVHLRRLHWKTDLGAGDPSHTGFLTGLAWGVKGLLLTLVYRLLSPGGARPVVVVTPKFENACFSTMLDCIFEVKIGYIIVTGFKTMFLRFK